MTAHAAARLQARRSIPHLCFSGEARERPASIIGHEWEEILARSPRTSQGVNSLPSIAEQAISSGRIMIAIAIDETR